MIAQNRHLYVRKEKKEYIEVRVFSRPAITNTKAELIWIISAPTRRLYTII